MRRTLCFGQYYGMSRRWTPSARVRVDLSAEVAVGPGKIALLEGISRTGSLSAAARELGMSYRRAWMLVHSVNEAFREPVVEFATGGRDGGGAQLTPFGEQLVSKYRGLEMAVDLLAREAFRDVPLRTRPTEKADTPSPAARARRPLRRISG